MAKFSLSNRGNSFSLKIKIVDNNRNPVKRNNLLNDVQGTDVMNVGEIDTPTQINADIDPNIIPENIKEGVSILGVEGTFGGGKFTPSFLSFYYFRGDSLADEISKLDTSNITDMRSMFEYCEFLTELDLKSFDTSNVTNMTYMFQKDVRLQKVDFSSFDTRNVTTMFRIFRDCWGLQEITFGENWITPNVEEEYSNISGTWTNQETGVSYTGVNALIEAGKTAGALKGTWKRS